MYARLTEVEKMSFRRANDGALMALWHRFKHELPLQGLTEEQGFAEMVSIRTKLNEQWAEANKNPGFGRTWLF
jgi:hypothetical protein